MSIQRNANALVSVRMPVTGAGASPLGNTNELEITVKELLIAAFSAIPSQAAGTATVGAIVTALQTLP